MQVSKQDVVAAGQTERAKKGRTWETPRLIEHGTVAQITAGGSGTLPDTGGGNSLLLV
jgi:hypothetical protein